MSTLTMPATATALVGNMTRDAELRYSATGRPWASFGLAVSRRVRNDETGEWEDAPTEFFDVVCFGDLAENVAASLTKGARVVVAGHLKETSWTSQDGTERHGWKLVADDIGASMLAATVSVAKTEPRAAPATAPPDALSEAAVRYSENEEPF